MTLKDVFDFFRNSFSDYAFSKLFLHARNFLAKRVIEASDTGEHVYPLWKRTSFSYDYIVCFMRLKNLVLVDYRKFFNAAAGTKTKFYHTKEKWEVISGCSNCGKIKEKVIKALKESEVD